MRASGKRECKFIVQMEKGEVMSVCDANHEFVGWTNRAMAKLIGLVGELPPEFRRYEGYGYWP